MIDPEYLLCVGSDRSDHESEASFSLSDVCNYNPLQELSAPGLTPSSCYELLSVMNVFSPIYEPPIISNITCTFLDLCSDQGCLMAMRGRYPRSNQYSLSTQQEMTRLDATSTSPEGLAVLCRQRNPRGISLAYTCQTDSEQDTVRRVVSCVACLSMIGTLCVRIDSYTSTLTRDIWVFLAERFSSITLYKPGVLDCVKRGCLIVCSARYPSPEMVSQYIVPVISMCSAHSSRGRLLGGELVPQDAVDVQLTSRTPDGTILSDDYPDPETQLPPRHRTHPLTMLTEQIEFLEGHRLSAVHNVARRVNNRDRCDISQHISRYRGM